MGVIDMWGRRSRTASGVNLAETGSDGYAYPTSHEEWIERYDRLWSAYVGDPYTLTDVKGLHLFRALDPNGHVQDMTTRLSRDVQHVVDTDVGAIAGRGVKLEGQGALHREAEATWRRSRLSREIGRWSRVCASMGDIIVEAARQTSSPPYDVELVHYDPRHVRLTYDTATGRRLERVVVTIPYFDPAEVSPHGEARERPMLHTYVRVLTATDVSVYIDGVLDESQSGEHGADVVPVVHVPFLPYTEPEHGLWAAVGLERPIALVDSLLTQIKAIGNRHANPLLKLTGVKLAADSDVFKLGRVLSGIPADGDAAYLEATMSGVTALLQAAEHHRQTVRSTLPEFLFTESAQAESGKARSYRAALFVSKMGDVRQRFYAGLAEALGIAAAMAGNRAYVHEDNDLTVVGGPILPPDVESDLDAIERLRGMGAILPVDIVRHGQRLGLIREDVDPETYAAEAEDRSAARAMLAFGGADDGEAADGDG